MMYVAYICMYSTLWVASLSMQKLRILDYVMAIAMLRLGRNVALTHQINSYRDNNKKERM